MEIKSLEESVQENIVFRFRSCFKKTQLACKNTPDKVFSADMTRLVSSSPTTDAGFKSPFYIAVL